MQMSTLAKTALLILLTLALPATAWAAPPSAPPQDGTQQPAQPEQPAQQEEQGGWLSGLGESFAEALVRRVASVTWNGLDGVSAMVSQYAFQYVVLYDTSNPTVATVHELQTRVAQIAMALLVLIYIYIGISYIVGNYDAVPPLSHLIVRPVVALLGIRFGAMFMQWILDASYYAARAIGGDLDSNPIADAQISANVLTVVSGTVGAVGAYIIIGVILLILLAAIVIWGWLRVITIYALYVVSPLVFVLWILPAYRGIFSKWGREFVRQSLLVVAWAIWMKLGSIIIPAAMAAGNPLAGAAVAAAWGVSWFTGTNVVVNLVYGGADTVMAGVVPRVFAAAGTAAGRAGAFLTRYSAALPYPYARWATWLGGTLTRWFGR